VATAEQIRALLASGLSYRVAAQRCGIDPGLAYLIATGLPADGSDAVTPEDTEGAGNEHVLGWIKQRAHSDAAMLAAAAVRDAEPGPVDDPDDVHDVLTVLTRDHNQVTALVQQLSAIPSHTNGGSPAQVARRASIVDLITVHLSKHEAVEEELFWPAVRKALADGDARAEEALAQERQGKDTLSELAGLDPDSREFDEAVERLVALLRKHVSYEERVFLDFASATEGAQRSERDALGNRPAKRKGKAPDEEAGKRAEAETAREE
jgi:hemerythrin-like domain-containing protein